jgi:RNA polymerase primary sigma factor
MQAVKKYDCDRGSFASYAAWKIREEIEKAIASPLQITRYQLRQVFRLRREKKNLSNELGREPTSEELALRIRMTAKQLDELLILLQSTLSIDKSIGDENSSTAEERIPDRASDNPENKFLSAFQKQQDKEQVREALLMLTEKEKAIFTARCGFDENRPVKKLTLKQLAEQYGCSQQRISQIYKRAVNKLQKYLKAARRND